MKRDYDETKMKELEQISVTTYNITSNAMMITQVETVAQFGVIFLLFALGLEFSAAKLRVVRAVAIPGGLLQIFLFMCLSGITASLCGGKLAEGIFVGAFLSMSSTAVDCAVGLLFALLPVLGGTSGVLQGMLSMAKSLAILIAFLAALIVLSRTWTNELYQLAAVAFCLLVAWCSDKLGLSLELGSFSAGVMISTTDLAQHTLEQVEPIRNFFAALFLASIGMLIHMHFLWNHVDILVAVVLLVIVIKTVVVAIVVNVGMSLAQIGEFAFVLLSRASNLHLIEVSNQMKLCSATTVISSRLCKQTVPPTSGNNCSKPGNDTISIKVDTGHCTFRSALTVVLSR
ncbi:hypothetical protein HID58_024670 [Brassica napus]|uniref:Cation/H+ exchanger transmembrane domain-containing protein n=1 Tax=Brassica napus TaxID=3708 RepID=A0ABQ8CIZ0_BRANA|nr:hypothetical protein HID58_024670 [Brassica napus]